MNEAFNAEDLMEEVRLGANAAAEPTIARREAANFIFVGVFVFFEQSIEFMRRRRRCGILMRDFGETLMVTTSSSRLI
jgi:histidinol-phosphate/aromatic aminotransferase/cobyric acid decarboxylase-like protein